MNNHSIPSPLHLGLTGYPLGHTLSPVLHNAALKHYHLEGDYKTYPVPPLPEGEAELAALMGRLRRGELHGLNVTLPHKLSVLKWMDELTPSAQAIGAVNTIIRQGSRLVGDNTDAPGFWADIHSLWGLNSHGRALVIGSGGAARSMVYALASNGWNVTIAAARPEDVPQADRLAADFSPLGGRLETVALNPESLSHFADVALLVNATPLGMSPNVEGCPWPEQAPFPPACKVYDVVYNPLETRLVQRARALGIPAETGLGMLICQAALAFERWTGLTAPFEVMRRSVG